MSERKSLYESPGEKGKRGFEDLEYTDQSNFDLLYQHICQAERTLNGFMSYARRQRAGSQDYRAKRIGERPTDDDVIFFHEETN